MVGYNTVQDFVDGAIKLYDDDDRPYTVNVETWKYWIDNKAGLPFQRGKHLYTAPQARSKNSLSIKPQNMPL